MRLTNCHPEAAFWPKDLPRCFSLDCSVLALAQTPVSWPKSRVSAFQFDAFREVLRPKSGLRMTDQKTLANIRMIQLKSARRSPHLPQKLPQRQSLRLSASRKD